MKTLVNYLPFRSVLLLAALVCALVSCDKLVFEEEGDCVVNYRLRFVYNMNLKWADAFPSEVHSVHLYAFDRNGLFVKEFTANGPEVDSEDYRMLLDLAPGRYTLVAWCGMENVGVTGKSFTVPVPVAGQTRIEELTCALNVASDSQSAAYSDTMLHFLYHGIEEVDLPDVYNGDFDYTIYLTKDTNHIRIILQQLSGEDMDPEEFTFLIEDANGWMGHDNRLLGTQRIDYRPWSVLPAEAGIIPDDKTGSGYGEIVQTKGLVADLSTSRLMADHRNEMVLTITGREGKTIARVPLLQYALMSREYYELAYDHRITDQELLDREDEYIFTFFLDDSQRWTEMHINILSWRMTVQNQTL